MVKNEKLKTDDFIIAMKSSGLDDKVINNIFKKFLKVEEKWLEFIDISFIPVEMKKTYKELIKENLRKLL